MPLSEDEQRILGEIEANLRASDPELARQVGSTTVYSESMRRLKWGVVGFIVALVGTILALAVSYVLAFVGFVLMLAAAVFIESNARAIGRAGINEATHALRGHSLRDYLNNAGNKTRDRLRRDDD